jgi:hypothetical protein
LMTRSKSSMEASTSFWAHRDAAPREDPPRRAARAVAPGAPRARQRAAAHARTLMNLAMPRRVTRPVSDIAARAAPAAMRATPPAATSAAPLMAPTARAERRGTPAAWPRGCVRGGAAQAASRRRRCTPEAQGKTRARQATGHRMRRKDSAAWAACAHGAGRRARVWAW